MTRSPTNSNDRRTTTGVVGYELAQNYEMAKTLLLFGVVCYALGAQALEIYEPGTGLPTVSKGLFVTAAVVAFFVGVFMTGFAASIIIRYIRAVGVTHYVRSAVPV